MTKFNVTKIISYDAELLKDIVLDIEKYPNFLPWCSGAQILSRKSDIITAELEVIFVPFKQSYISEVRVRELKEGGYLIDTRAISGPFEHLNSIWEIKMHDNGSLVQFSIDFALKSKILGSIIGVFFLNTAQEMVSAFEKRAHFISDIKH
jgi:coenzyme Q-binding protein COQ10